MTKPIDIIEHRIGTYACWQDFHASLTAANEIALYQIRRENKRLRQKRDALLKADLRSPHSDLHP